MSRSWYHSILDRYQVTLPDDVVSLLDASTQSIEMRGEFDQVASWDDLVSEAPTLLLPGMMLPNVLPLLSNRYGDWLCGSVDASGQITEVIHWYHGGGDWIPYGNSLAEAVLYDSCQAALGNPSSDGAQSLPVSLGRWIADSLKTDAKEIEALWQMFRDGQLFDGLQMLLDCQWCQAVAYRDLIELALASPLRLSTIPGLSLNVPYGDMTRWKFDAKLTPESSRDRISQLMNMPFQDWSAQNWSLAKEYAHRVLHTRTDLAWAWHIAGYADRLDGNLAGAIHHNHQGLAASVFSDQSVRMRTHWFEDRFGKFAAAQLAELQDELPASIRSDDYLQVLLQNDPSTTVAQRVVDFWCEKAKRSDSTSDAYACWLRAGWDVGCSQWNRFEEILTGLAESAKASNWPALAKLAESHLAALQLRQPHRRIS
jgi:hypothetical protein